MATNMRDITQQNIAMQELLKNVKSRRIPNPPFEAQVNAFFHDPPQVNYYHGKEKVQS